MSDFTRKNTDFYDIDIYSEENEEEEKLELDFSEYLQEIEEKINNFDDYINILWDVIQEYKDNIDSVILQNVKKQDFIKYMYEHSQEYNRVCKFLEEN